MTPIEKTKQDDLDRGERFMRHLMANEHRIYGFILSLVHNWSDADDLLQDVTTIMWRKFDQYELGTNFCAWGLKIARFEVLNFRKKQRHRRTKLSPYPLEEVADLLVKKASSLDSRSDALQSCLGQLNMRDQELIALRYESGATTKDVSEVVNRSIHAIYKALNRVHGQLLDCIEMKMAREDRS